MRYVPRQHTERLRSLLRSFRAVLVLGPRQCMQDLGLRRGWVVSTARERRRLSPGIEIIPWAEIASGHVELF